MSKIVGVLFSVCFKDCNFIDIPLCFLYSTFLYSERFGVLEETKKKEMSENIIAVLLLKSRIFILYLYHVLTHQSKGHGLYS